MSKTLADYLLMVQKEYTYKIKIAHAMDEKDFERMERPLLKYDIIDVKSMIKTPIQKNPLDFPTVSASEVYIIEIVSLIPISTETLRCELAKAMHFHMDYIHVRNENSPYNEYEEKMIKFQEETYMPKLDDPFYKSDATGDSSLYGDEYNENLVKEITDKTGIDMPMEKTSVDTKFKDAVKTFKAEGIFNKVNN
jgi:hypothetical protein